MAERHRGQNQEAKKFMNPTKRFLEKEEKVLVFAKHGKGKTYPRGNQRQG